MIIKKSKSIREQIYEKLKEMILDGTLKPGERIVEVEFAERFKISRTPLREAIRMLELEELLESIPNGGVFVKKIALSDIEEVYQIRIALEGIILKEIIQNSDNKGIKKLETLIANTEEAMKEENNSEKIFVLFSEFNNLLYNISKYPKVVNLIKNINMYLKIFRKYSVENSERKLLAHHEHVKLVDALKEKDIEKALAINEKHLLGSKDFLMKNFKK